MTCSTADRSRASLRRDPCTTGWLIVRSADGRILGDLGTHGPPGSEGCVEIGYSLAPSARGQGIGTAAVAAFVRRLAEEPGIQRITAVTGAQNTGSRPR